MNLVSIENTTAALSTLIEDFITDDHPLMLAHQINFDQYLNNTIDKEGNTERRSLQVITENKEEIVLQDTDNKEYDNELQGDDLDSVVVDNIVENGSDHDPGDDKEEDSKESNIRQQYENCMQIQSQQFIRLYGDTSYSLQLHECLKNDLI